MADKSKVRFHREAVAEAEAAFLWYRERNPTAAQAFRSELVRAVDLAAQQPQARAFFEAGTRRCAMRRFPFFIVFREVEDGIEVVAVAHAKRRPGYWHGR